MMATRDATRPSEREAESSAMAARPNGKVLTWSTAVLTMVGFLAAVDRQTISTLLVPIQRDLHVNDAAMGMLTGSAFALIYAFIALPLARLADKTNRRNIIAIAVTVWSAATAACGIVFGFVPLLLARIGVGAAEAAHAPSIMSMIGDLTPAHRRGSQVAIITAGTAFGFALGGLIGGVLNDHFGWHVAMLVVGLPGVLLGLVIYLTVAEPLRGAQDGALQDASAAKAAVAPETWMQSLRRAAGIRSLHPFVAGYFCSTMAQSGWLIWTPAFLMRVHRLSATQMGAVFAGIVGAGVVGSLVGGMLGDVAAKRGPRWRLYFLCACMLTGTPFLAASLLAPSLQVSLICMIAFTFVNGGTASGAVATYLSVAPAGIRGTVTALMNIVGLGLGGGLAPLLFGAINDALCPAYAEAAVRYTLLLSPLGLGLAVMFYLLACRRIDADARTAVA